jgi:hypothetical protein
MLEAQLSCTNTCHLDEVLDALLLCLLALHDRAGTVPRTWTVLPTSACLFHARCGQTTRVSSGRLAGLAEQLVEPGAQGLRYLDSAVLGAEPAHYARGCLERGRAAGAGVEVPLNLDAGGLLERSLE